ncbi:rubredoxin [Parasphingorhabdus sp.]|uniref:rubredoxin n=1 Tax=Parasphingorhabdus sp. TaxID=2709688 RepID=UPI003BB01A2D
MAKYQCPDCGYIYDEADGDPHEGFGPGTPWSEVPESWSCPDCAVRDKIDFTPIDGGSQAAEVGASTPITPDGSTTTSAAPGAPFRKWVCITCGHVYDEAAGDQHEGFAVGTRFEEIPDDWCCPDCGASKGDYVLVRD